MMHQLMKRKSFYGIISKSMQILNSMLHAVNGGASKARNTCIEHAQGDLIFNLDSDNYLEPRSSTRSY